MKNYKKIYTLVAILLLLATAALAIEFITVENAEAASPSATKVKSMIDDVFGKYTSQAKKVAACESGYNANAYNKSSGAAGIFQFLKPTWAGTKYNSYSRFNALANIKAAYQVFTRDGHSWREWPCKP